MYSIKAVCSLTGLGAETLRAWERRYETILPGRDNSGRRFYSQQDLEKLTLLANLTRNGHAISKVSALDIDQLNELIAQSNDVPGKDQSFLFTEQIVDALINYRIDTCEQLLKRALIANEPLVYARDILMPTLNEVGRLWHEEKLSIAQEHMFSACLTRIILSMVNNLYTLSHNRPGMLFATPSAERHEFGILIGSLLAAGHQFNCYYLGADLPGKNISEAARHLKPAVILMSLVKTPPEPETITELNAVIDSGDTAKSAIWIGGMGARYLDKMGLLPNRCELIADIDHFNLKMEQFKALG